MAHTEKTQASSSHARRPGQKKTGTKKSYISRLENGKIDIQISTLFKIFEEGLGKKLGLTIQ